MRTINVQNDSRINLVKIDIRLLTIKSNQRTIETLPEIRRVVA